MKWDRVDLVREIPVSESEPQNLADGNQAPAYGVSDLRMPDLPTCAVHGDSQRTTRVLFGIFSKLTDIGRVDVAVPVRHGDVPFFSGKGPLAEPEVNGSHNQAFLYFHYIQLSVFCFKFEPESLPTLAIRINPSNEMNGLIRALVCIHSTRQKLQTCFTIGMYQVIFKQRHQGTQLQLTNHHTAATDFPNSLTVSYFPGQSLFSDRLIFIRCLRCRNVLSTSIYSFTG